MTRLAGLIVTLWLVGLFAAAEAMAVPSREEAVAIADRWAAEFPQHPNHCSGGRLRVAYSPDLGRDENGAQTGGFADGWTWTGQQWAWDHGACRVTLLAGMALDDECWVRAHELMHFVIGPGHAGPLDPRHPGALECYAHRAQPAVTARRAHRKVKRKRTQAQINRSIRHRRAQARIKARRAAVRRAS